MYDLILDVAQSLWKYGATPSAVGMSLFALMRTKAFKRKLKKHMPFLFPADGEINQAYVQNQARIEMKVDLLLKERDIEWSADTSPTNSDNTAPRSADLLALRSATNTSAHVAESSTKSRRRKLMSKFKSRKFWMAVVTGALIILNDGLDLGIDTETVLAFAGIVATFIIGEAAVDTARAKKKEDTPGDTGPAE